MRALFIALIALFAMLSISCCGSSVSGPLSSTKAVMDDDTGSTGTDTGSGSDNPEDPDYIFYDSEGDDFDSATPGDGTDPTRP